MLVAHGGGNLRAQEELPVGRERIGFRGSLGEGSLFLSGVRDKVDEVRSSQDDEGRNDGD